MDSRICYNILFTDATQKEILEDNYPVMLINGKKVAEVVSQYIYRNNITLEQYLAKLGTEQEYRNPEDILKEE